MLRDISMTVVFLVIPALLAALMITAVRGRITTGVWGLNRDGDGHGYPVAGLRDLMLTATLPVPTFAALAALISFVLKPSKCAAGLLLAAGAAFVALGWMLAWLIE